MSLWRRVYVCMSACDKGFYNTGFYCKNPYNIPFLASLLYLVGGFNREE